MSRHFLHPAGRIARPTPVAEIGTSLGQAVRRMREAGLQVLPVTSNGKLVGILTQSKLFEALSLDVSETSDVALWMEPAFSVDSFRSGAEAFRLLEKTQSLVVIDADSRVVGIIEPSSFWEVLPQLERPPLVGGMATPFGVYLTNGSVGGGKKGVHLVLTGILLFSFFLSGKIVSILLERLLPSTQGWSLLIELLPTVLLLLTFRLLPIAGYHAAEHMVVHAIEEGEPLTSEVVKRMPRVHPRCGTNLAVGLTMFMSIWQIPWAGEEVRLITALLTTLFFWRAIGSFVQKWITTRPPNEKQIQSGIQAANQLLEAFAVAPHRQPNPFQRIFKSGMLHVMLGSLIAYGIATLIGMAVGLPAGTL
jgi:hypothetical protein